MSRIRKIAAASVLTLATGATGLVTMQPAEASEGGPLCHVDRNSYVFSYPGGSHIYTIAAGGGFRLHSISYPYAFGHGNGHSDGWIRIDDGRLYC